MTEYDVVVIGAGPGGYVAAIRATQLGLKAVVIEKDRIGGVCLNIGCIPSKTLISQAAKFTSLSEMEEVGITVSRENFDYSKVQAKSRAAADSLSKGVGFLLKKNKVDVIEGVARLKDPATVIVNDKDEIKGKHILIATGSSPAQIPGFEFDGKQVLSSNDVLMLTELPESIVILGSGAIGMEFAYIMSSFGVTVTIVEMLDRLMPLEDVEVSKTMQRIFKKKKLAFHVSTRAVKVEKDKKGVKLHCENKSGEPLVIEADKLLVAVGRKPNTGGLGLEEAGININERGFIETGDFYQTAVSSVYAIGDVVASPMLAHVASKEGEIAVEHMAGHATEPKLDPMLIPGAVYTEPQVASFGLTEQKAQDNGIDVETASFTYRGAGKSVAIGEIEGFAKLVVDKNTREILGAHIIGAEATELIHELLLARKGELLPQDIATMVHAHPTLSEVVMEVARASEGWVIHN